MPKLKANPPSERREWEPIPEHEVVDVTLTNVELHEFEWNTETIQKLRWTFVVTEEPWVNRTIRGETTTNFVPHPNCKAYAWATALSGVAYPEDSELDTDDMIGMKGRAIIEHQPGKDGRVWERVRDVLPTRKAQAAAEQAQYDKPEEAPF